MSLTNRHRPEAGVSIFDESNYHGRYSVTDQSTAMDRFITNNHVFTDEQLRGMGYVFWRQFPDGEWAAVTPMTFGKGRICHQLNPAGYEDGWCYETLGQAIVALEAWDPNKDDEPAGWFRHPYTGRRREGGDPSKERVML